MREGHTMDAHILDEAAQWMARRHATGFGAAQQAELAQWRSRSATHEAVWQRIEQLQLRMDGVPPSMGMAVLNRSRAGSRRHVLRATALVLATPMLGWLSYRHLPWQVWSADFSTATGETRDVTLADHSHVLLNTASAISTRFDSEARRVRHHAGEILVETAHDSVYQALPFVVQTDDGLLRALGTRFTVRKHAHGTTLAVLQGAVQVTPAQSGQSLVVQAGEQVSFNSHQTGAVTPLPPHTDAWVRGTLYAQDMRLDDFLAELQRYRPGVLQCAPGVADLRVSGVFQLRDTDRILELLTQTLRVRTQARTRYWVTLIPA
ncbi:iron uptake regulator [Comamonas terrigena NBRC 13299]|nr:iron uptake regulator [Comamonas terrigena NBRC 13299]